jgi:predicted MFS family arabinose efflux permease
VTSPAPEEPEGTRRLRDALPLLVLLSVGRYLAFLGRLNIVPFYPELMHRFGTTYAGAGALFSAFFVGYALTLVPAGAAADRRHPRRQMAAGLALLGLAGAAVALAPTYPVAFAARVAVGVAVALTYTTTLKLVAVVFSRANRGRAVGVMEWATSLGMLTALSALPVLSQWVSYRVLLLALPVLCAPTLVLFPRVPLGPASAPGRPARPAPGLGSVLGRDFVLIAVSALLGLFTISGILSWLPSHLTDALGYSKPQAGAVMAVVLVAQMLGVYPAGSLSDRLRRRLPLVWGATAAVAVCALALAIAPAGLWIYVLACVLGLGMSASVTPLTVLSMERFGPERAGLVGAVTVASGQAGSGLSGVVFGWILDRTGSFTAIWLVTAALAALRLVTTVQIREGPAGPRQPGDGRS